ncbi:MAG: hypothetical protein IIA45_05025 [Bacteroidetes bacterium]|nr:hypothetical protein [Bacteroidota bacterium]
MNEHGLRKLRIRGISAVNKVMMLTAAVYNLKKLLKYQLNRKISWSISLTVPIISNGIRGKILINLKTTLLRLEKAIYHEFSLMGFDKLQKLNYH